jgi:hypothetical protein
MILYRSSVSAREQLASATPEHQQAGMEAWRAWAEKTGYAIADLGTPLAHTTHVGSGTAGTDEVTGYSILNVGSADEVETARRPPHLTMPGTSIEVLELIPIGDL